MSSSERAPVAARAAFQHRDFRLYVLARFALSIGIQMQTVAIGWQVYSLTHRPLDLGFVGLAQFLPAIGFSLITGAAADRFDRKRVLQVCYVGIALCATLFFVLARLPRVELFWLYAVMVLLGTFRAFAGPASQAFVPHLVPVEQLSNAVTWNSSAMQVATIAGPAAGGLLYAMFGGPAPVYATCAVMLAIATVLLSLLRVRTGRMESKAASWALLVAGIRYVWEQKIVLGSISLDLFAVLFGGATALLPIYANDVLHIGPMGLGLLRSAPAIGAMTMAVVLAYRPLKKRAGAIMLGCVAVFGVATVVFGLSHNVVLSMVALIITGAADMVSVVVRLTLVQLATPPPMRGRVSAVNMVFIGASNDLGELESGVSAAWLGAVPAVVVGGIGTLVVVAIWALAFPGLRRIDRVEDVAVA